jgi:hypothetical protein
MTFDSVEAVNRTNSGPVQLYGQVSRLLPLVSHSGLQPTVETCKHLVCERAGTQASERANLCKRNKSRIRQHRDYTQSGKRKMGAVAHACETSVMVDREGSIAGCQVPALRGYGERSGRGKSEVRFMRVVLECG